MPEQALGKDVEGLNQVRVGQNRAATWAMVQSLDQTPEAAMLLYMHPAKGNSGQNIFSRSLSSVDLVLE